MWTQSMKGKRNFIVSFALELALIKRLKYFRDYLNEVKIFVYKYFFFDGRLCKLKKKSAYVLKKGLKTGTKKSLKMIGTSIRFYFLK